MAIFIRFILLGVLLITVSALDEEDVGNANEYIDTVLENLRKEPEITKHMDPLDIPGTSSKRYSLSNIQVRGLSHLYRQGDCSLTSKDTAVNLIAEIAVKDVIITIDYRVKALFFWIKGNAQADIYHTSVKIDITSIDGNAQVNSVKVTNLGPYKVTKFKGGSFLLNWLLKLIANEIAQKAKGYIINVLEREGKSALNNVLKQHKLPLY